MVVLLWFLTVTCSCCPYLYFGLPIMWVTYLGSWMTTCLGKNCSFGWPRVPFVNCQFMYLVISLLVSRAGYGIWLYQFLITAYLTLFLGILSPPVQLTCTKSANLNQLLIITLFNKLQGQNDHRNYFMINLHESYVAEPRLELTTPGIAVILTANCATVPGCPRHQTGKEYQRWPHV